MGETMLTQSIDARGVATLTLNRPEKHNALDGKTISELHNTLLALQSQAELRAVVLTGSGPSFCAGADLTHMKSMLNASEAENQQDARALAECLRLLNEFELPSARPREWQYIRRRYRTHLVCGHRDFGRERSVCTLRSPLRLSACDDLSVRRGSDWDASSTSMVCDWRDFRCTHGAPDRLDSYSQRNGNLDEAVNRQLDLVLRAGPIAVREAKSLIRTVAGNFDLDSVVESTSDLLARLRVSPEGQEGVSAFLERRKPSWK